MPTPILLLEVLEPVTVQLLEAVVLHVLCWRPRMSVLYGISVVMLNYVFCCDVLCVER